MELLESRNLLSAGGLTARYVPPVVISQNSAIVQPLMDAFYEADGARLPLRYSIVADTNASLFARPPVTLMPGLLVVSAAGDASGSAELTLRATDPQGQTADCTVTVEVQTTTDNPPTAPRDTSGRATEADSAAAVPTIKSILQQWEYYPDAAATDAAGDVFVYAGYENSILKIESGTGDVTTLATLSSSCWVGGIAADAAGNVYIADTGESLILKVDLQGSISTIAGTPGYGGAGYDGDGGQATSAKLNGPTGVAVDALDDIFIADTGNNCIREVNAATGVISTIAGNGSPYYLGDNGPATEAGLNGPMAVATDAAGNVFIADTGNNVIRKVDRAGIITTVAGSGAYGFGGEGEPATSQDVELAGPMGLALDAAGNVFVADTGNNCIREVNLSAGVSSAVITSVAGKGTEPYGFYGDDGPAAQALLCWPTAVATDREGNLYIVDVGNGTIREVTGAAAPLVTLTSSAIAAAYGQDLTFTATVGPPSSSSDSISGTATFYDGTDPIGWAPLSSGQATFSTASLPSPLSLGTHAITARYSGDDYHAEGVSNPLSVSVNSLITLTAGPSPATEGRSVTVTAGLPFGAIGTVSFQDNGVTVSSDQLAADLTRSRALQFDNGAGNNGSWLSP